MDERAAEVLAVHADILNGVSDGPLSLTPEEEADLQPLMEVAGRLKRVMVPVEPSTVFVRSLGRELVEAARRQQKVTRRLRRGLLIGAAALGSLASVVGVVALVLHRRRARTEPQPAPG